MNFMLSLDILICLSSFLGRCNTYNPFHNILKYLDVLANFPFTTSETMPDYYL